MDETGQPGGATPKDGGDQAYPQADRSWSDGGWSTSGGTWSRPDSRAPGNPAAAEPHPGAVEGNWHQPARGFASGEWVDQSARFTDMLAAQVARSVAGETRYARNGVNHGEPSFGSARPDGHDHGDRVHGDRGHGEGPRGAASYDEGPHGEGPRDEGPHGEGFGDDLPYGDSSYRDLTARHHTDRRGDEPVWNGRVPTNHPEPAADEVIEPQPRIPIQRSAPPASATPASADPVGNVPVGNVPVDSAPAGSAPTGDAPVDDFPVGKGPDVPPVPRRRSWRNDLAPDRPSGPSTRYGEPDWSSGWTPRRAAERAGPTGPDIGAPGPDGVGRTDPGPDGPGAGALTSARLPNQLGDALPQRVPGEPDVPVVPEPPAVEPPAETPELARIATHLRRDDPSLQAHERPDGFDVSAILAAVLGVPGVRDAALRTTPAGAHSLRLDLADGADAADVSRQVARLLQERMGLAAAPQNLPGEETAPPPSSELPPSSTTERRAVDPSAAGRAAPDRGAADWTTSQGAAWPEMGARCQAAGSEGIAERGIVVPRRRRQSAHQGRASAGARSTVRPSTLDRPDASDVAAGGRISPRIGPAANGPAAAGPAVNGPIGAARRSSGSDPTTAGGPVSRPLNPGDQPGPRVVIDHVQVSTFGLDATVEVRLAAGERRATGLATGPAVDGYVLRLCAASAASAVDELLRASGRVLNRGRCFVEHAAVVPFGSCDVAVVVVLLVCDGWVEQLAGSALVDGDQRQAVVRATLSAVNRRLAALLS